MIWILDYNGGANRIEYDSVLQTARCLNCQHVWTLHGTNPCPKCGISRLKGKKP